MVKDAYGNYYDPFITDYIRAENITTLAKVSVTESQTIYENFNAGGYAEQFNFMRFKENATLDVTHSYTKTYQKRESWLETGVSGNGTAAIGKVIPAETFSTYDVQPLAR